MYNSTPCESVIISLKTKYYVFMHYDEWHVLMYDYLRKLRTKLYCVNAQPRSVYLRQIYLYSILVKHTCTVTSDRVSRFRERNIYIYIYLVYNTNLHVMRSKHDNAARLVRRKKIMHL